MSKRGRKGAYETKIKPNFEKIKEFLEAGLSERQISKNLGIAYSTFNKYKAEKKEFAELLEYGRAKPIEDLKNALFNRAIGAKTTEKTIINEYSDKDGHKTKTTVIEKEYPPDTNANTFLLMNWDKKSGWSKDPQSIDIKREELEEKKKQSW